ncbi:protein of unknown function [Hyphomicrobium sp. 1Nfss2.1]
MLTVSYNSGDLSSSTEPMFTDPVSFLNRALTNAL